MCTRKICELRYSDVLKLADILENETKHCNWNYLGKHVAKTRHGLNEHQIDFLKHGYIEKESGSWTFLNGLPTKVHACSIRTFQGIAKSFKRMDVYIYLDSVIDKSINVWDLPEEKQLGLVYHLEQQVTTLPDWKMFADELGYSYSEIKNMVPVNRRYERPTVLLFNLLISKYPSIDMREIISIVEKSGRFDVIEKLNHMSYND